SFVGSALEAEVLDPAMELGREGRMLEERVLEPGCQVDLGRLDLGEAVEQLVGERRRSVLHGTRDAVFLAADLAKASEHFEVELHVGDATVGQRNSTVRGAGLD